MQLIKLVKIACQNTRHWYKLDDNLFEIEPLSGGLINRLFLLTINNDKKAVIRIINKDPILEPAKLFVVCNMFASRNMGPKIYGTFENGQIEEYLIGHNPTIDEFNNKNVMTHIASLLSSTHKIDLENIFNKNDCAIIDHLNTFIINFSKKTYESKFPQFIIEIDKTSNRILFKNKEICIDIVKYELQWLIDEITNYQHKFINDIVFSHNDIHHLNVIYDKNSNMVTLIDYELCGYNYRCYDIGSYFNELSYINNYDKYPGFFIDSTKIPKIKKQKLFVKMYLNNYHDYNINYNDRELEIICNGIKLGSMLNHLFVGLWCISHRDRNEANGLVFDFFQYGKARIKDYFRIKTEYRQIFKSKL